MKTQSVFVATIFHMSAPVWVNHVEYNVFYFVNKFNRTLWIALFSFSFRLFFSEIFLVAYQSTKCCSLEIISFDKNSRDAKMKTRNMTSEMTNDVRFGIGKRIENCGIRLPHVSCLDIREIVGNRFVYSCKWSLHVRCLTIVNTKPNRFRSVVETHDLIGFDSVRGRGLPLRRSTEA